MKQKSFSIKDGGLYKPVKRIFILSKIVSKVRISKFPGIVLVLITLKGISS